jgi:ribosomal protein S13
MFIYKQYTLNINKELRSSLQTIYGIYKSNLIAIKLGLSFPFLFKNLNSYNLQILSYILDYYT